MANIINEKATIKNKKLKNGFLFVALAITVFLLFLLGNYINTRYYYFLILFNIIVILATAYFGVKFFLYLPYKDGSKENFMKLTMLSNKFCILNGIMINDEKYRAFFEHIIISPQKIYFINLSGLGADKQITYNRLVQKIVKDRGIDLGFKSIYTEKDFNNLIQNLNSQKDEKVSKQQQDVINKLQFISI